MFICKQHYVLRSSFKKSIQVEKSFHICEECIWWRNVFKLSASERWNTTSILKKLLYQQRHYPRDDIETSTHNVFGEDAWRESERWKFHERKFFYIFTESQMNFHLALAEERFLFSSIAAIHEACCERSNTAL
jgi:hypothetical protein